jgi:DNA topoisomerase-1
METDLDKIELGKEKWVDVVREFYLPFEKTLGKLAKRHDDIKESITEATDEVCGKCGSPMVIKWGRNGRFMACSSYPECKTTKSLESESAPITSDIKCANCGSPMVVKTGRFGKFLACSAYPECKTTMPLPTGAKCPKCDGDVVQKQSKRKKIFYGCSKYPGCNFVSWDKPVNQACPKCNNNYMVEKFSKKSGIYLACPVCKHKNAEAEE